MKPIAPPLLASLFAILACSAAEAGQCGFFDLLFGCAEPQYPRVEAPPPPRARRHVVRPGHAPDKAGKPQAPVAGGKQIPLEAGPGETTGSLAMFRRDHTLRTGDIVATPDGFYEFRAGSFQPVGARRTASLGLRLAGPRKNQFTRTAERTGDDIAATRPGPR
ncbi:MAG: hypothetical protein U1E28_22670 [Beijerinckiaceae bacterium]